MSVPWLSLASNELGPAPWSRVLPSAPADGEAPPGPLPGCGAQHVAPLSFGPPVHPMLGGGCTWETLAVSLGIVL